jgi:dCMP deaminase
MKFAIAASERATCSRLQVGAIIVVDNKIVSSGYNGATSKQDHCEHWDDGTCMVAVHAEPNAIMNANAPLGPDIHTTMYVTHAPCISCATWIIDWDFKRVVYYTNYKDREGIEEIKGAGIELIQLQDPIFRGI